MQHTIWTINDIIASIDTRLKTDTPINNLNFTIGYYIIEFKSILIFILYNNVRIIQIYVEEAKEVYENK